MKLKILLIFLCFLLDKVIAESSDGSCDYGTFHFDVNIGSDYGCLLKTNGDVDDIKSINGTHYNSNKDAQVHRVFGDGIKVNNFPSIICEKFKNLDRLKMNIEFDNFDEKSLENCKNLHSLKFSNGKMKNLPKNIFTNQRKVFELFLDNNQIEDLSSEIFNTLDNLIILNLNGNNLKKFKLKWFENKKKLEILTLNNNQFEELPEGIFKSLFKLQRLEISGNKLTTIQSASFGDHYLNFSYINFAENKINSIDEKFIKNVGEFEEIYGGLNSCIGDNDGNLVHFEGKNHPLKKCFENYKGI